MPITNIWMLSAVVTPAGQIGQIIDQDLDFNIQEMFEGGSGTVDAEFAAIDEAKPVLSFGSTAVASALAIAGLNAYAISSATDFYFQQVAQGGVRNNTGAIKVTASKGILVPKSIEASHGGKKPATIKYELHAISADGTTAPLTITPNQTLPSIAPVSEMFTLGTCGLNAGALSAITRLRVDFGIKEQVIGCEGNAYPTFAGITSRRCKLMIDGYDMTALNTFGVNGLALTSWKVFLRKIAPGATRVPDGTAQHVKLFGTTGMFRPDKVSGSDQKEMDGSWGIFPTYDGTNAVIQVVTASAIN